MPAISKVRYSMNVNFLRNPSNSCRNTSLKSTKVNIIGTRDVCTVHHFVTVHPVDDKMFHRLSENFDIKVNMSVTHDMSGAAHSFDTVSIKTLNIAAWHVT